MPAPSMPLLHQDPYRRTSIRKYLWTVRKVNHILVSMNKVVCDLGNFFEKIIKELSNQSLDMIEHQQQKVK